MTAAGRSGQGRVGAEGLIPFRFVGRGVTLGSSPRGWRHRGTLSLLVRSDEVGHSGFPEQEGKLCTVPHCAEDDGGGGGAAIPSPVWTGVSEQWARRYGRRDKADQQQQQAVSAQSQRKCFYSENIKETRCQMQTFCSNNNPNSC